MRCIFQSWYCPWFSKCSGALSLKLYVLVDGLLLLWSETNDRKLSGLIEELRLGSPSCRQRGKICQFDQQAE
jgi:hypothetical protein